MLGRGQRFLPVTRAGRLVGVITRTDYLRALRAEAARAAPGRLRAPRAPPGDAPARRARADPRAGRPGRAGAARDHRARRRRRPGCAPTSWGAGCATCCCTRRISTSTSWSRATASRSRGGSASGSGGGCTRTRASRRRSSRCRRDEDRRRHGARRVLRGARGAADGRPRQRQDGPAAARLHDQRAGGGAEPRAVRHAARLLRRAAGPARPGDPGAAQPELRGGPDARLPGDPLRAAAALQARGDHAPADPGRRRQGALRDARRAADLRGTRADPQGAQPAAGARAHGGTRRAALRPPAGAGHARGPAAVRRAAPQARGPRRSRAAECCWVLYLAALCEGLGPRGATELCERLAIPPRTAARLAALVGDGRRLQKKLEARAAVAGVGRARAARPAGRARSRSTSGRARRAAGRPRRCGTTLAAGASVATELKGRDLLALGYRPGPAVPGDPRRAAGRAPRGPRDPRGGTRLGQAHYPPDPRNLHGGGVARRGGLRRRSAPVEVRSDRTPQPSTVGSLVEFPPLFARMARHA